MRNKKYTIILSIITVIESIFVLAIPYFTNELVDYSLAKDKNNVIIYSILLASICILSILFHVLDNILYSKYSLKLEEEIKKNLYDLISKKAFPDLNKYHAAEIELL
jgi:ATP-binding cassette subfamily B protein